MSPEQYGSNIEVIPGTGQRVEYAIRLPGGEASDGKPLWLPIDAKFPIEDYQRLVEASESSDLAGVEAASRRLQSCIRKAAKEISEKYIHPPHSTDFAVMFLPAEGLFAEVVRCPGLAGALQREHRIILAGPTTLTALISSLQMGFRTLAIQKSSSEVWQTLAAVKTELGKYAETMDKLQKKLKEAQDIASDVQVQQRTIGKKLKDIEALPRTEA